MKHKRIFISGGAGVIGSVMVQKLLEQGAELFVGDLKPQPLEWEGKLHYRMGDLNYLEAAELADFQPEIAFHLAATFERTAENLSFYQENFQHNIQLSHFLLGIYHRIPSLKRVVFASSYLVYDGENYLFDQPQSIAKPIQENALKEPRNLCGAAKFYHEAELSMLGLFSKFSWAAARIFRVYGRGSRDVISRWIRAVLAQEAIQVFRPEGLFDYIYADDVAEGLIRLAKSDWQGAVNLGTGKARRVQEVVDILSAYFPDLKKTIATSTIPFEASQANMSLFTQITGWQPQHTLETAIPEILRFEEAGKSKPLDEGNLLITSLANKTPLVHAVRKALAKIGASAAIHGCDMNQNCLGRHLVDKFWAAPEISDDAIHEFIHYCQINNIKQIIPTRDGDLLFFSKHLKAFEYIGVYVMVSAHHTIQLCHDKLAFYRYAEKHGFPIIPTYPELPENQQELYVVKERCGAGSVNIGLKLNRVQAAAHAKKLNDPVFQPYIEGKEWSVDLYSDQQARVKGCVARTRDLVHQGESYVTTTVRFPELEILCAALADTLKIKGHAIIQVIQDLEGHFHIIECNPRFGGASTASLAAGLDSFYWFLLETNRQDLKQYPFHRKDDVRQVRIAQEIILPVV